MSRNEIVGKSILQMEMKYSLRKALIKLVDQLLLNIPNCSSKVAQHEPIRNHLASLSQRTCKTGLATTVLHNNVQTLIKHSQQIQNKRISV